MDWSIKHYDELTKSELYRILQERTQVFVVEQNCPYQEVDGKDLASYHLYQSDEAGRIIAYLRILPAGVSYAEASLGRVLVAEDYRRKGIASELVGKALHYVRHELNEPAVRISAQAHLEGFYQSFGFKTTSQPYLEDGIPHINMLVQWG
ncbi:GNAT family N-acetyltransferase [Paenibacillus sambharensis]|uniref:GNAT family N-acetyltransferase n=1 Tax=Paenibacillus sambharensis TaxID=1803190 RepID=A0A2W1LG27_9BACL|nr:GNAT family N-acetyltransferase [Paenibacillus sambharensis]PZD94002.1 GNAT family N-acetyltransferase [Paenibacillus sambharensis]